MNKRKTKERKQGERKGKYKQIKRGWEIKKEKIEERKREKQTNGRKRKRRESINE